MQLTVKGKNVEVTEALRSYAEKRLGKITRYFDHILSIDVTLSTERNWHIAEVNVFADSFVLRGEERTSDMYTTIDKVLEKLEKQVKKHKDKTYKKQLKASEKYLDLMSFGPQVKPEEQESASPYADLHLTVNRIRIERLSVEQALKQMEATGHLFQVFQNRDNSRINILFKRKEGYGLIDPVLE